jgi:hypothetical protein
MTVLAEEFVDALNDPDSLPDFPPTFETLTREPPASRFLLDRLGDECEDFRSARLIG